MTMCAAAAAVVVAAAVGSSSPPPPPRPGPVVAAPPAPRAPPCGHVSVWCSCLGTETPQLAAAAPGGAPRPTTAPRRDGCGDNDDGGRSAAHDAPPCARRCSPRARGFVARSPRRRVSGRGQVHAVPLHRARGPLEWYPQLVETRRRRLTLLTAAGGRRWRRSPSRRVVCTATAGASARGRWRARARRRRRLVRVAGGGDRRGKRGARGRRSVGKSVGRRRCGGSGRASAARSAQRDGRERRGGAPGALAQNTEQCKAMRRKSHQQPKVAIAHTQRGDVTAKATQNGRSSRSSRRRPRLTRLGVRSQVF